MTPYDFFSFSTRCSEKATKVQDIKNNLKEAIEVCARFFLVLLAPVRQNRP